MKPFFSNWRAVQVGSELIARFVDQRQKEGAKNATINRELACLKRMFKLGQQASPPKVYRTPPFPMLKERNVRLGFVEDAQYDNLAAACAEEGLWLRAMFEVGYTYGWRHSEVLNMRVEQVNLLSRSIRLEPGTTKNDRGRQVQMTPAVHALLSQCISGKQSRDYVFTRTDGKRIRDFRGAWWNACIRAGLGHFVCKVCSTATETRRSCETCKAEGRATNRLDLRYQGLLFHDLRRTAARNFRRAGVAEGVIMKIGGWLTRTVFDRYAIVSQSDLTDAVSKLQTHRQSTLPENGHDFGHTDAEPVSVAERRNIN